MQRRLSLTEWIKKLLRNIPMVLHLVFALNVVLFGWLILSQQLGLQPSGFGSAGEMFSVLWKALVALLALSVCALFSQSLIAFSNKFVLRSVQTLVFLSFVAVMTLLYSSIPALFFMSAAAEHTAATSLWYLRLDTAWGVYTYLTDILSYVLSIPWLYWFIDLSYTHTLTVFLLPLVILPFFSFRLVYQYINAAVILMVVAAPFWLISPAIAPLQLSFTDTLDETSYQAALYEETRVVYSLYEPRETTDWGIQVSGWIDLWESVHHEGFGYAISSNPSMHLAWGVVAIWYLWCVSRVVGLLLLPFFLGDAAGTMIFLQHYIIDLPMGIAVAVVSIWIASKISAPPTGALRSFWFGPYEWFGWLGQRVGVYQDKPE